MTEQPIPPKDPIVALLESVPNPFFRKALENYNSYLIEKAAGRKNSLASSLYYAVYLVCLGNYFKLHLPDEPRFPHNEVRDRMVVRYRTELNLVYDLNHIPNIYDLRLIADYHKRTPKDKEIEVAERNANKIIKELVVRT